MELCNTKYDRSLYPSKAIFYYQTDESDFVPLEAEVSYIRGKKASFAEGYNSDSTPKNNAPQDLAHANLLAMEECYVPPTIEEIYCRFSLRVEANSLRPSACANIDTAEYLSELASNFKKNGGYQELALRYAKNILLGTWLWKNQNSGDTNITVKTSTGTVYQIDNTRLLSWDAEWSEDAKKELLEFANELTKALTEPRRYWSADITAKIKTAFCQEIFPSQPLLTGDRKTALQKNLSKTKCRDGKEAVILHRVKIGAAIQLIDDWWSDENSKRLRVHEYGADQDYGIAHRAPGSKVDFFSIFSQMKNFNKNLKKTTHVIEPELYYFFAVLIKGGVFTKKQGN
ncbi:type I-F CRISPR-associated protein Csy3 [Thalassotalea ganghwensis]